MVRISIAVSNFPFYDIFAELQLFELIKIKVDYFFTKKCNFYKAKASRDKCLFY